MKVFERAGAGLDWLFSEVAGTAKGVVTSPEWKRILGVGVASALAGMTPEVVKATTQGNHSAMVEAVQTGFITGLACGTVSYLHRRCDGPADEAPKS